MTDTAAPAHPLEVHLVELTLLFDHRYSATLGYLQAAVTADPELAGAVSMHRHVVRATPDDLRGAFDQVLAGMAAPDVLALTVYFWNRPQSLALAAEVKQRWPGCLVVLGGNDVTHQQEALFAEAPHVDVLVHGEGELRFADLLRRVVAGAPLDDVTGLSFWAADRTLVSTPEAERVLDLDTIPSPLLGDTYSDAELAGTRMIIYETNRGCPYSCAFCYWGGYTNSKIRQFPMERVRAELERIVRAVASGTSIFVADANFGILGRDLEIAEHFVALCTRYDKRVYLVTNWAKNTNAKVLEIATLLHRHGLTGAITLAAQSFDEGVLETARRSNIKIEHYRRLQREFVARGIPTYTDLIWGLPGESYASHQAGVEEVIRSGGCPVVYPLLLLNNTEYTTATFRAEHGVVVKRLPSDISNPSLVADVVVGHRAMTTAEWVRGMQLWLSTSVFHKTTLRVTLRYLSHISGIATTTFCDALIDFLLAGPTSAPETGPLMRDYGRGLLDPSLVDRDLLESVLGRFALPEDQHYQAVLHAVLADPRRHLPLLREAAAYLVDRFALAGTPGIDVLPGALTLDAAGGSMYRAGLVHRPLRSVFAVSPQVLDVATASGDVPPLSYDAADTVVHGMVLSAPERSDYPVTGYALMLNKGTRKLLWDGEYELFPTPPAPVPAVLSAAQA